MNPNPDKIMEAFRESYFKNACKYSRQKGGKLENQRLIFKVIRFKKIFK